ncbi:MAG: LicD family protein [Eubacterium sp.]|nr:LicD family protein [Eubacterium sp.]
MENKELSLKEIQKKSLEILKEVDSFCRNNQIKYFLAFGTLIGAIRHSGFIPWDDDIDIIMLREDYDKFLDLYKSIGTYRIINFESEKKCPFMITRITDDHYTMKKEYGPKYKIGTFIDVYPFDGVGISQEDIKYITRKTSHYAKGLARSIDTNPIKTINVLHNGLKKWLLLPLYLLPKILGTNYYREKLIKLSKRHTVESSDYIGCVIWDMSMNGFFKKKWFEHFVEMKFEGMNFLCPREYDKVLKQNYNDYMKLPPENQRIGHHFYKMYRASDVNAGI